VSARPVEGFSGLGDIDPRGRLVRRVVIVIRVSPRHCERSEAIHFADCGGMDCFVASLLAMTVEFSAKMFLDYF
jgi:hypothetical protein